MATVESNIRRLDDILGRIEFLIAGVVDRTVSTLGDDLAKGKVEGFESELYQEGLDSIFGNLTQTYADIMTDVADNFGQSVADGYSEAELSQIEGMIHLDTERLRGYVSSFASNVQGQIARAAYGTGSTDEVASIIEQQQGTLIRNVLTDLINGFQGFRNALTIRKVKQGDAKGLLYAGPKDEKNRPFCASHVGKVFTLEEISQMDNGTGLPVLTNLGGWNCRHEWRPAKDV